MSPQTEAACLLESGALYGKRVLLLPKGGDPIFAGVKAGAFSLYFGDAPIYHFDLGGRWQRAFLDGLHELKGLDGSVRSVDRVREGENLVLRRRTRPREETEALDDRLRTTAETLLEEINAGRLVRVDPPADRGKAVPLSDDELKGYLREITRWDRAAWSAQRSAYQAAYGPWPILPPDCQNPVVLQATLGQADGRGFGGASVGKFLARTPEEFGEHVRAVSALLGRRIEQCKTVFLAGPDVLRVPPDDVVSYLATVDCAFPVSPGEGPSRPASGTSKPHRLDGVHAFLDQFRPPLPDRDDLGRFRSFGLTRVSLGVESGDPDVRALLGKDWPDQALRAFVADLKAAGIGVGLMTLVGAGGREADARHAAATAELIHSLDLGKGDLVSLLDANEIVGLEPDRRPGSLPFTPLTNSDWSTQLEEFKLLLGPLRAERHVKVAPYSLEKQVAP